MTDIVDEITRSKMMSKIRSKDTKPELIVRRFLHAAGFRFRLHRKGLPGQPDLVLPKYRLVIFVHGCFWHRHPCCAYATVPKSKREFWAKKFSENIKRDKEQYLELERRGWRVAIIWECGIKRMAEKMDELIPLVKSDLEFFQWPEVPPKKA